MNTSGAAKARNGSAPDADRTAEQNPARQRSAQLVDVGSVAYIARPRVQAPNVAITRIRPPPIVCMCPAPCLRWQSSVHGVVLRHEPVATPARDGDGKQILINSGLTRASIGFPLAAIVQNDQRPCLFPVH
jgi:hypothetical protein